MTAVKTISSAGVVVVVDVVVVSWPQLVTLQVDVVQGPVVIVVVGCSVAVQTTRHDVTVFVGSHSQSSPSHSSSGLPLSHVGPLQPFPPPPPPPPPPHPRKHPHPAGPQPPRFQPPPPHPKRPHPPPPHPKMPQPPPQPNNPQPPLQPKRQLPVPQGWRMEEVQVGETLVLLRVYDTLCDVTGGVGVSLGGSEMLMVGMGWMIIVELVVMKVADSGE
jgi:hypothetical protein